MEERLRKCRVVCGRTMTDKPVATTLYCDKKCAKSHTLQERSIDLRHRITADKEMLTDHTILYKEHLNHYKEQLKQSEEKVTDHNIGEALFTQIKFHKAAIDFNESLLRREKRDILHMKRYKCLKVVGDLYEAFQKHGDLVSTEKHQNALSLIHYFNDHDGVKGAIGDINTFGTD